MFEIRKATPEDIDVIRSLASVVFPHTYKEILSPEQLEYMMEWLLIAVVLFPTIHDAIKNKKKSV